ncbi:MAG: radical SAM protein [Candidatus Helarchaeota archaeon]
MDKENMEIHQLNDEELITRIKNISKIKDIDKEYIEKYIENLKKVGIHPCYSEVAHFKVARIHLPVAPKCNIQCKYCKRSLNKVEFRPGVSKAIMTPQEALEYLEESLKKIPNLKIVGIAGPGEPLANPETFETLRLVHEKFPKINLCLATNGLELPRYVDTLSKLDIANITVTINAIDPKVSAKIYEFVIYNGKKYHGEEAGSILLKNQLKGIKLASQKGILIRINTVLIPTINLDQIESISRIGLEHGAIIHNIMPLIPIYQFKNLRRPTREEMHNARKDSQKYLPQFRLCKQCRADAVGIPGLERIKLCNPEDCSHVRFHG